MVHSPQASLNTNRPIYNCKKIQYDDDPCMFNLPRCFSLWLVIKDYDDVHQSHDVMTDTFKGILLADA